MGDPRHSLALEQLPPQEDPLPVQDVLWDVVVDPSGLNLAHGAGRVLRVDVVSHALLAVSQAGHGASLLLGQEAIPRRRDGHPVVFRDTVLKRERNKFLGHIHCNILTRWL